MRYGLRIRQTAELLQLAPPTVSKHILFYCRAVSSMPRRSDGGFIASFRISGVLSAARAALPLEALRSCSRNEWVFENRRGKRPKSIRTAFATACRRAKLSGVTPHVLRHTFAMRSGVAGRREALERIAVKLATDFPAPNEEQAA